MEIRSRFFKAVTPGIALCFLSWLWIPTLGHTARSYKEAPIIKKTVLGAGAGKIKKLIHSHKEMEPCKGSVIKAKELQGTVCRLKVFRELNKKSTPDTTWMIKHNIKMAKAVYETVLSVETYKPIDPPPRFLELQYDTAEAGCHIIQDVMESLAAIKPQQKNKTLFDTAQAVLEGTAMDKNTTGLREALCNCSKKWLHAADKTYKSMEEKGAIQRLLTSRGCFLDMKKAKVALSTERKAGPTKLSGNAGKTAALDSDEQRIKDYAQTRDFTLDRCRVKIGPTTIKKPNKVQKCLCREIKRWRFPSHDGNAFSVVLPIEKDQVGLRVNIDPKGKVEQCGPLEGPKVPPLKP